MNKELFHKRNLLKASVKAAEGTTPGSIRDLFLKQATRIEQEIAQIEVSYEGRLASARVKKKKKKVRAK